MEKKIQIMLRVSPDMDSRIQTAANAQQVPKTVYITRLIEADQSAEPNEIRITLPPHVLERLNKAHADNPYWNPQSAIVEYLIRGMKLEAEIDHALSAHVRHTPSSILPALEAEPTEPQATPTTETESAAPETTPTTETESAAPETTPTTETESAAPETTPTTETESAAPETTPTTETESAAPEKTPPEQAAPEPTKRTIRQRLFGR